MKPSAKPSQSVSAHMAKGQSGVRARMLANLRDCSPKVNHHFCPPLRTQADSDKSQSIHKAMA